MSVLAMRAATKQATVTANGLPHSTTPEHKEAQQSAVVLADTMSRLASETSHQSMGVISAARFRELGVTVHCDVPCVNRDELLW